MIHREMQGLPAARCGAEGLVVQFEEEMVGQQAFHRWCPGPTAPEPQGVDPVDAANTKPQGGHIYLQGDLPTECYLLGLQ